MTLLYKGLISQKLSMPFCNLVSQMPNKVGQVPVQMPGCRDVRESLRTLLVSLVMDGLLECSHLRRGLVLRDCISSCDLGFLQLVLQRPVLCVEPGEFPLEQPSLNLGPL